MGCITLGREICVAFGWVSGNQGKSFHITKLLLQIRVQSPSGVRYECENQVDFAKGKKKRVQEDQIRKDPTESHLLKK